MFSQIKWTVLFKNLSDAYYSTTITCTYLASHLASCGISHLTSSPHTLEHNGYVERRHMHIVETALSLLSHANMPLPFWTYAVSTATYLINRLPTINLQNGSPFFCIFHKTPNYNKLRSFGCLAYPQITTQI